MEVIIMQVNHKRVKIHLGSHTYKCFEYMNDIKDLKKRVRYVIKENEQNRGQMGICSWHFISDYLNNPSFKLVRLNENEFVVERMGLKHGTKETSSN